MREEAEVTLERMMGKENVEPERTERTERTARTARTKEEDRQR